MRTFTAGPLRVRAAGGIDREGRGDGPAVVLCHGYGAPGDDLVALARVLDAGPGVRWFFPEAPLSVDLGPGFDDFEGRAWWPIDMARLQRDVMRGDLRALQDGTPPGLDEAREALAACVDALALDEGVRPEALVIGGFSQGAMVTTEWALASRPGVAGLAILSGTVVNAERWRGHLAAGAARGLDVWQSHGVHDAVLPFALAEALRDLLAGGGARVEFVPFRGAHEIPPHTLEAFGAFARARLGPPAPPA
jgi:phospholipase/carboxylesterase